MREADCQLLTVRGFDQPEIGQMESFSFARLSCVDLSDSLFFNASLSLSSLVIISGYHGCPRVDGVWTVFLAVAAARISDFSENNRFPLCVATI